MRSITMCRRPENAFIRTFFSVNIKYLKMNKNPIFAQNMQTTAEDSHFPAPPIPYFILTGSVNGVIMGETNWSDQEEAVGMQRDAAAMAKKIEAMDAEKRQRILNASMEEFSKGFSAASTDNIVKKAGISKGLLFHYFGTKRDLYLYVIDYALVAITREYTDLINTKSGDILERLWQMSLLKRELCFQHPDIFSFLTSAYYIAKDEPGGDFNRRFAVLQEEIFYALYSNIDPALLKPGIDGQMASNVIRWTLTGLSDQITAERKRFDEMTAEYDVYLEETKRYLDLLRRMLYHE